MVHVHQCFQAVGHGTFFTGVIATDADESIFSWVYDCGSKRPTRLEAEISDIEPWECWPGEIDLFVVSHFDDDHVNGVERFLSSKRVRHLALPYMDAAQRLAAACSTDGETCSASTALFQLDTTAWLRSRGLSDRVDAILLVRGGRRGPDDPSTDAPHRLFRSIAMTTIFGANERRKRTKPCKSIICQVCRQCQAIPRS